MSDDKSGDLNNVHYVVANVADCAACNQMKMSDKETIHASDVQDIINMMKEDLDLVKNKAKNDEVSLNDPESPKSSRTFDNEPLISSGSSNNGNENDFMKKNSDLTEAEEEPDTVTNQEANYFENAGVSENCVDVEYFNEDENDPNHIEIAEFIEKAKQFGANALDLSKKNLIKVPKTLLDLSHLQV